MPLSQSCPAERVQAVVVMLAQRIVALHERGHTEWVASVPATAVLTLRLRRTYWSIHFDELRCHSAGDREQIVQLFVDFLLPRLMEVVTAPSRTSSSSRTRQLNGKRLMATLASDAKRKVSSLRVNMFASMHTWQ
jgi:hypothetical protein